MDDERQGESIDVKERNDESLPFLECRVRTSTKRDFSA